MGRLFYAIFLLSRLGASPASPGSEAKTVRVMLHSNSLSSAGAVRLRFENLVGGMEDRDSMLIIFDRYDHTAAGVVHQVCAAGSDQCITIDGLGAGKYFVTIQCFGLHRDRLQKIVTIRNQRSETVRVKLLPSEAFSRSRVFIPGFHPDLCDLAVVRFK